MVAPGAVFPRPKTKWRYIRRQGQIDACGPSIGGRPERPKPFCADNARRWQRCLDRFFGSLNARRNSGSRKFGI